MTLNKIGYKKYSEIFHYLYKPNNIIKSNCKEDYKLELKKKNTKQKSGIKSNRMELVIIK